MKETIKPDDCRYIFDDRFEYLTMKDIGIELRHFSIGTAPEFPSVLVNQEELKQKLINKFLIFFDKEKSIGGDIIFLESGYGNGKSHFLRIINTFFKEFKNVFSKKVSFKQEKTELKSKILEAVGQKIIKDMAYCILNDISKIIIPQDRVKIQQSLIQNLDIDINLSKLLYEIATTKDVSKQAKAISILKNSYSKEYPKTFSINLSDLNNKFYFDVIRLVCDYIYKNNIYIILVFDEYEHIYSWKDTNARRQIFEDIKSITDDISKYKNLFFIFAKTKAQGNIRSKYEDDPAYSSREKGLIYIINDINSENDIKNLLNMIIQRYEKYYNISLTGYEKYILDIIKQDSNYQSNYRSCAQLIMRELDKIRENPQKYENISDKQIKKEKRNNENSQNIELYNNIKNKWNSSTSISRKTMLCETLEYILENSDEKIVKSSKKQGLYKTKINGITKKYIIVYTEKKDIKPSDFDKIYKENITSKKDADEIIYIYPDKNIDINKYKDMNNVIFYKLEFITENISKIYEHKEKIKDVLSILSILKMEY